MKTFISHVVKAGAVGLVLVGALTACGGGGDDDAGAPVPLNVTPPSASFAAASSAGAGVCVAGGTATVFINGGAAPYRVDNTMQGFVAVDKTTVDNRGDAFVLTVTQPTCITNGIILVVDKLNNQVTVTVNNTPAT